MCICMYPYVLCVGESKALPVLYPLQHSLREARTNIAWHVITVIVLAFLTAGKMQSTIKHGKGRGVCAIMVLGVVSIHNYCTYSTSFCALTNAYSVHVHILCTYMYIHCMFTTTCTCICVYDLKFMNIFSRNAASISTFQLCPIHYKFNTFSVHAEYTYTE